MENWRGYQEREELLSDHRYITEVLGVRVPLTEAYPYSPVLTEEIENEQRLLEQWWTGGDVLLEGPIGDWWQGTKEKVATYPETLQMLYVATTGKKTHAFTKAITKRGMSIRNKIIKFIDFLIAKGRSIQNPIAQKLVEWATKVKNAILKAVKWVSDISKPWMKALGLVTLSVGLQFAWSKIVAYAEDFFACGGDEDEEDSEGAEVDDRGAKDIAKDAVTGCFATLAQKFLGDKVKDLFGGVINQVADVGSSVLSGGVTKFWGFLKKIAKGVGFVVNALAPTLAMFKSRGGLNEGFLACQFSKGIP
jgi:hypothetical protein